MLPFPSAAWFSAFLTLACWCGAFARGAAPDSFHPGTPWRDTQGNVINAHGGGVLFHAGRYYWYGEHKFPGRSEAQGAGGGVHCYSSADLVSWTDEGLVLRTDPHDLTSDLARGCILERPKVIYNARTGDFVMFCKLYPRGTGYDTGYVGVSTARQPNGPFTYRHKFLGGNSPKGTGDYALVEDEHGVMHHLAVRKPDKVFVAGALRDDYLLPAGDYAPVAGVERHTEAPAIVRHGGRYYLIGSGSSGWEPNAARSFVAEHLTGPYRALGNPTRGTNPHNGLGPARTFGAQISFLLPVHDQPGQFIALFDLWRPARAIDGLYAWLPVTWEDERPVIAWRDEWRLRDLPAATTAPSKQ